MVLIYFKNPCVARESQVLSHCHSFLDEGINISCLAVIRIILVDQLFPLLGMVVSHMHNNFCHQLLLIVGTLGATAIYYLW